VAAILLFGRNPQQFLPQRVYQLTALVTKLPPQIKDLLAGTDDPAVLRFFTERRLRPLTMIPDGETQMAQFAELLTKAEDCASGSGDIPRAPTEKRA
jgi:hypothetical protein